MLAMFDPMMLPKAISASPTTAAVRFTASSGALVPKATTVRPTVSCETPNRRARDEAPSTTR